MPSDAEYIKEIEEAWDKGLAIAKSTDGWKEEKSDKKTGDVVESKKNEKGKKIYRCKAKIKITMDALVAALRDTDKVTSWNDTVTESRILKRINDDIAISYQVTADGGGGMVSPRDFIYGSKVGYDGKMFVMGGRSVDYPDGPSNSKIVRAFNGPGCQTVTPLEDDMVEFVWVMDCDYKGWIPGSILEIAMPIAQTQFIACIRKLAAK